LKSLIYAGILSRGEKMIHHRIVRDIRKLLDHIILILPIILFPLSFIVFREFFIVSMTVSTVIMGTSALVLMTRKGVLSRILVRGGVFKILLLSFSASIVLYTVFFLGGIFFMWIGMWGYVANVYSMIRTVDRGGFLQIALAIIGFMEEIYWRGYLQNYFLESLYGKGLRSLVIASIYYTVAHIPTMNIPLIAAALVVGIILGYIASRSGISGSIVSHIAWLEAVIIYAPIDHILAS
jgi:hypothetical protein